MASLQGIDPKLKEYIRVHQLPDVYESLLTGLLVVCPDDPLEWIIQCMEIIKSKGIYDVAWDMFVPEGMHPSIRQMRDTYLDEIFTFNGEGTVPTTKMYAMAYNHYNYKMLRATFGSWMTYFFNKKNRRKEILRKMHEARLYYKHRVLRIHLHKWLDWKNFIKNRNTGGYNIISRIYNISLERLIFNAWRAVAVDARKTREYFERLEKGELDDDFDAQSGNSSNVDSHRDEIALLPRSCAIKIFSNLSIMDLGRCMQVCRAWKVITGAPSIWSHLNFSRIRAKVNDRIVQTCLSKCKPYLVHLNLRGCNNLHQMVLKSIAECRNLQDLNLSECKCINDDVMRTIAEGCPTLLYLNISHTEITDGTVRTLGKCSSMLQYLSLAYCRKFTDRGLYYLSSGKLSRKLSYLDLSGCNQLTSLGFQYIASGCSGLQTIELNDMSSLSDPCIIALADKCQSIKSVSLIGSPNISDSGFKALCQGKRLQKLRIEENHMVTDAMFKTVGKMCPQLQHIYVVDCQRVTDIMLKALSSLRHLVVLNLADCVRLSDSGVRQMVEGPSGSKIREMNLTNCVRVSDVSLLRVAQRCHSLTHLCLCYCEHVTDAGIELLASMASLTHVDLSGTNIKDQGLASLGVNGRIKYMTISECHGVTDLGLQKFCQQVKELEGLDVSHCMALTDSAIKNLAFCCRMLVYLNVAGCFRLTDLSIQYLSGVCHYIHILNLSGCIYISDRALKYLNKGCRQLRTLTLLFCKSITKHTVQKMRQKLILLQYNNDPVPPWYNYDPEETSAVMSIKDTARSKYDD